jgi:hypothetical protein
MATRTKHSELPESELLVVSNPRSTHTHAQVSNPRSTHTHTQVSNPRSTHTHTLVVSNPRSTHTHTQVSNPRCAHTHTHTLHTHPQRPFGGASTSAFLADYKQEGSSAAAPLTDNTSLHVVVHSRAFVVVVVVVVVVIILIVS